mgnify:CR=1 FL=1
MPAIPGHDRSTRFREGATCGSVNRDRCQPCLVASTPRHHPVYQNNHGSNQRRPHRRNQREEIHTNIISRRDRMKIPPARNAPHPRARTNPNPIPNSRPPAKNQQSAAGQHRDERSQQNTPRRPSHQDREQDRSGEKPRTQHHRHDHEAAPNLKVFRHRPASRDADGRLATFLARTR